MAVMPRLPETKMVAVGKLISLGNLLVRKVMWLVFTTASATLIFVLRIWSRQGLPIYTLVFQELIIFSLWLPETTLSFSTLKLTETTHTLSLIFWLPAVNPSKMYIFYNLFLSCSTFSIRLAPASNTTTKISSNPERDKQPTWEKTHAF